MKCHISGWFNSDTKAKQEKRALISFSGNCYEAAVNREETRSASTYELRD